MSEEDKEFRNFISAMKIEQAAREEGYEVIGHKDFGDEQFFYLKKEDKNVKE